MTERLETWATLQAARRPEATAVVGEGESLTYGELERASNRLARALIAAGCRPDDRVALLMPKSPGALVGILAIYKAGGIYVPLDPASPAPRLEKILRSSGPRLLLAGGPVTGLLDELAASGSHEAAIIWPGPGAGRGERFTPRLAAADLASFGAEPPEPPRDGVSGAAHLLYTSGSTGTPKGVVITHANVIPFIEWAVRDLGIGPADRLSGHPPLHFDLSILDIFGTFRAGASLWLVPPERSLLPHRLAGFIRDAELTQWFSVPSVLAYMAKFDAVRPGDFPALRRLLWCGEVFPTPSLIHWMRRLPHVRFTNLYGPTETTVASSHYTVPECPADERAPIPIGTACDGEELLILDSELNPVADGGEGDLYIRGVGLSPGYWNLPDKTREAFLPAPNGVGPRDRLYRTGDRARRGPDGLVYFLGRGDTQVKSRGYRIELGEIETALDGVPMVRESAVVAAERGGFEGRTICCAYVPAAGGAGPAAVRRELSRILPGPMIPAVWRTFDHLPRNANGKVDRARLRRAFESDAAPASR
ncbi:MAG: amino acid adenylation domain-containing protein [Candidatus Polarisedimenticolia bacterium]